MPEEDNRKMEESKMSIGKDKVEADREEDEGEAEKGEVKGKAEEKLKGEEDEEKKMTKISDELDSNPFYHGLVSSDDLCFILSEVGDCTQLSQVVIFVETTKKPQSNIYEFIVSKYGSVKQLINDYIKEKRPIHPDVSIFEDA
uniref:ChSh domain-containing protein n=1 Tax=Loa loa TaxID=7209 RepID=A0A1I7VAF2_LOALO